LKIDNKTERAFGKAAVFAGTIFLFTGVVLFIAGAFIPGAVVFLVAAFVTFTYSGVELDTEIRMFRQYNNFFGIFKMGKWKSLEPFIGVTLIPMSTVEVMASWSNRISSTKTIDYRIFFVNKEKKPAFVIKKCRTKEKATDSLDEFSLWLKLPVYSVKGRIKNSWALSLN
jgi:hypothetical protein